MKKATEAQSQVLIDAGFQWNEELKSYSNGTSCINTTENEEEFQIADIQEGTPVKQEGVLSLAAAIEELAPAEALTGESAGSQSDDHSRRE